MTNNKNEIDPAALAVVALAAAISVIAPRGPYGPGCLIIGVTILGVVFAYDVVPRRAKRQSVAYSAVCALISVLALGFLLECAFAKDKAMRFHVLFAEPEKEIEHSEVFPLVILVLWIVIALAYYGVDRWRCTAKDDMPDC